MQIEFSNLAIIFLAGLGLLICSGVGVQLFLRKEGVLLTNYLLGTLLVLYALTTLNGLMAVTGILNQNQHLYFLPIIFNLSIAPLFYFFVRSKIQPAFRFERQHLIHFIIPVVQFIFYLSVGFRSTAYKSRVWVELVRPYIQYIEEGLMIVLGVSYLIAVLIILKKVPEELWKKPVYKWLKTFTTSFLILLVIHSGYEISSWIAWGLFEYNLYNSTLSTLPLKLADVGISFVIGLNAYIYQHHTLIIPTKDSSIDAELEKQIEQAFSQEKIYKDPELNLEVFSKMIGQPKNKISKLLSEKGDTFRGLVNRYRVNEFINLASSEQYNHLSYLGIAYESGFNSKASFNRVFKEQKGTAPSEFFKAQ